MTCLFACEDPVNAVWQLGQAERAAAPLLLFAWTRAGSQADSAVPRRIASVLMQALTSLAEVTFPLSKAIADSLAADAPATVHGVASRGILATTKAFLSRQPASFTLLSTRDPAKAVQLFEDPAYPWPLQGQAAILARAGQESPALDHATWTALLDGAWHAAALREAGVAAVLRPGVDGDVAGLWSLDANLHSQLIDAVAREACAAGVEWALVSEADFADRLVG